MTTGVKSVQEETIGGLTEQAGIVMMIGVANPFIYDRQIRDALKGKKTIVVAGPMLLVKDEFATDRVRGSIIPFMQKQNNFRVYCSEKYEPIHVVTAGKNVIHDELHTPGAEKWVTWFYENDEGISKLFRGMVSILIEDGKVKLSKDPRDFLYVTQSEMKQLEALVNETANCLPDHLNRTNILHCMKRLNHNYLLD